MVVYVQTKLIAIPWECFCFDFGLVQHVAKVAGVKVYLRWNLNNRAHAVTACICLWHHGRCDITGRSHTLTAWALKFQACLGYTFTSSYFGMWHHYVATATGTTISCSLGRQCRPVLSLYFL